MRRAALQPTRCEHRCRERRARVRGRVRVYGRVEHQRRLLPAARVDAVLPREALVDRVADERRREPRDLRQAFLHDVHRIQAVEPVHGRELVQRELGELRGGDECAGLDEEEEHARVVTAGDAEGFARTARHEPAMRAHELLSAAKSQEGEGSPDAPGDDHGDENVDDERENELRGSHAAHDGEVLRGCEPLRD